MKRLSVLVISVLFAGCDQADLPATTSDVLPTEITDRLPPSAPRTFGFGGGATDERIAMWDIDVKPDGEGLPPGSGTVAQGKLVYETQCIACHGATGTEGPFDRLVGTGPWEEWPSAKVVGVYWPYATTLFDYIVKAMPQLTPGTLTADQTYAVIAYVLNMNGLVADDAVMNAMTLPAVEMPGRDRFITDNRKGGPEVR